MRRKKFELFLHFFWEEALLQDRFFRDIDWRNHAIKSCLLKTNQIFIIFPSLLSQSDTPNKKTNKQTYIQLKRRGAYGILTYLFCGKCVIGLARWQYHTRYIPSQLHCLTIQCTVLFGFLVNVVVGMGSTNPWLYSVRHTLQSPVLSCWASPQCRQNTS